jgi:hypothetical protein
MGRSEVATTRTAISTARVSGRRCNGDVDDARAAVLLAVGDDDIAGARGCLGREGCGGGCVAGRRSGRLAMRMPGVT